MCAYFNFRVRMVDGLGLELGDWQLERAAAGAERASALATERGVAMPADPWGVRQGAGVRKRLSGARSRTDELTANVIASSRKWQMKQLLATP